MQNGLEARLHQKLEAADAAFRRHLDSSVMRLEAKLDSIALNASVCSNAAQAQQTPSSPSSCTLQHDLKLGSSPEKTHEQSEQDRYRFGLEKRLDRIASAVGVKTNGEEDDDRKRLKEKLKQAIERDKRSRVRKIESEQAMWLEYIFGICKADRHFGKRGSR